MVLKVSPCYKYNKYIKQYSDGLTLSALFSQLFWVRVVLSRWTFYKKNFLLFGHEKIAIYSKLVNNPFKRSHPHINTNQSTKRWWRLICTSAVSVSLVRKDIRNVSRWYEVNELMEWSDARLCAIDQLYRSN